MHRPALFSELATLRARQWHAIAASYLGWTLDAFDFFILVFVLKDVASDFASGMEAASLAITLTLAFRPVGALAFGVLAERYGRRPILMLNVLSYSALEVASGFAPTLTSFIVLRALYGIAMGGEWGVGAALAFESIPPKVRGLISGILQTGYPTGYLLASVAYYCLFSHIGWRGMFIIGVVPAFLVLYIRRSVEESPNFVTQPSSGILLKMLGRQIKSNWGLMIWAIVMMTSFNFLSHGTQDLYPTFLEEQRDLSSHTVGVIAIVYNIGAILGGLTFGILSSTLGRRRSIIIAALCSLASIRLWTTGTTSAQLAAGAFLMQFFVQGAWGVVPAHLNELSPSGARGIFPGVAYQLGNLLASINSNLQVHIALEHNGDYALALSLVAGVTAVVLALLVGFGREASQKKF